MIHPIRVALFVVASLMPVCIQGAPATPAGAAPAVKTAKPAPSGPSAAPATADTRKTPVRVLIKAVREARLAAEEEGKIIGLPFRLGQAFRKGDALVSFDCTDRNAMLASAEAGVARAQQTLQSKKTLQSMKAVADVEVGIAEAEYQQAIAQRDIARATVRKCTISAPFDGRVVRVLANQWESVSKGAPLIEIVDRSSLTLEALVPSAWMVWMKPGKRFTVRVDELGRDVAAEVTGISGRVDAVSQTVQISARIVENVPGLLPGMSGSATFTP